MNAYKDPTAWQAIANVTRELKQKPKPKPKPKKEYIPWEPVDWKHVLKSKHKKVNINKAWAFKAKVERAIDESRKTGGVL